MYYNSCIKYALGKIIPKSWWVDFSYFEKIEIPKDKKDNYSIPDKIKDIVEYV